MLLEIIDKILDALLATKFFSWLANRKQEKAQNAQNEVGAMSDDDIAKRLRDDWTR